MGKKRHLKLQLDKTSFVKQAAKVQRALSKNSSWNRAKITSEVTTGKGKNRKTEKTTFEFDRDDLRDE